jgi:hypothetical protein
MHAGLRSSLLGAVALVLIACAGATSTTSTEAPGSARKGQLTAAQCEAAGGKVVGDIGDGAIHRPDYVCLESGKAPLGPTAPEPGGPIAVEGAACCG